MLQRVPAEDKEVRCMFCSYFISYLEDEILQPKLPSVMKLQSISRETLIDITWEFGAAKIFTKFTKHTRNSLKLW